MASDTDKMHARGATEIRDLSDFCTKWPRIRDTVSEDTLTNSGLSEEARETIRWLRVLANKTFTIERATTSRF